MAEEQSLAEELRAAAEHRDPAIPEWMAILTKHVVRVEERLDALEESVEQLRALVMALGQDRPRMPAVRAATLDTKPTTYFSSTILV